MMAPNLPQIRVADIDLLSEWDLSENVRALGDSIPGYRSSATFLTTLRTNLRLSATDLSPYNSIVSTPTSPAFSFTSQLAHPTPSPLSIGTIAQPPNGYYDVPEPKSTPILQTSVAGPEHTEVRDAALKLIAESVKEQRWLAGKAAVLNQVTVAGVLLFTSIVWKFCSLGVLAMTTTTLTLLGLATLYYITLPYGPLALDIDTDWLETPRKNGGHGKCEDPIVLVSRRGEKIIGALVLRVVKRERKGYVRAWTVESSHRRKGIGSGLLEEAVRIAWGKGARCVIFEEGHANSHRVLPESFSGSFDDQEAKARMLLASTVAEIRREKSSR